MLQRKTDGQNDENDIKPLYHPHGEQSRVGG